VDVDSPHKGRFLPQKAARPDGSKAVVGTVGRSPSGTGLSPGPAFAQLGVYSSAQRPAVNPSSMLTAV
jgi:hypothetical protein